MSEREGRRGGSPLESERGITSIESTVVQKIAGLAAQEVEGVRMGGGASRAAAGFLGGAAGSRDQMRGISVEVGRTEAAIDLTMAVDYGRNILQTVGRVRDRIASRVEPLTGLQITELNVTVSDVVFPDDGEGGRGGAGDRRRALPASEPGAGQHSSSQATTSERADGGSGRGPLAEDQTAELRMGDADATRRQPPAEEETGQITRPER